MRCDENSTRGMDHGVDVPEAALSSCRHTGHFSVCESILSAREHIQVGRALFQ